MRAITHAEGKAIRLSRWALRGAGCWDEDDHAASRGRRYRAARLRGGRRRRPSSSHRARVHGWAFRWGRGPLGVGRSGDGRPGPGLRPLRPRLRSSAHARTARSPVARCGRLMTVGHDVRLCAPSRSACQDRVARDVGDGSPSEREASVSKFEERRASWLLSGRLARCLQSLCLAAVDVGALGGRSRSHRAR
jgi:hypothetical protein